MLRVLLLLFCTLTGQKTNAQWRLLYKSDDIFQSVSLQSLTDTTNPIILIEPRGVLSKYLIVRYAHSKRKLINRNDVWGFIDGANLTWRYYTNNLCRILSYNDAWIEYGIYHSRSSRFGVTIWYEPGFSRTLDSKIWDNWSQAMADLPPKYIGR